MDRDKLRKRAGANPMVRFGFKAMIVSRTPGALRKRPKESLRYLFRGREMSNNTYELANNEEIPPALSGPLGVPEEQISACVEELLGDRELYDDLVAGLRTNSRRDDMPRYGKRILDYCVVRIDRPGVVMELGTHDGLGAAVVLRALERNAAEGSEGRLWTFDGNPEAGWLVPDRIGGRMSLLVGEIRANLEPAMREHGIDYLISDIGPYYSDRSWAYELSRQHTQGSGLLIRDEMNGSTELSDLAASHDGRYGAFREQPVGHFGSGHTIAIAALPAAV